MTTQQPDPAVRQALFELQRYLSDQVAPLMVADSIELLLSCPPRLAATAIEGWVASQYGGNAAGATISDFLYHALKKIHMMAHLRLIDRERLAGYLKELSGAVVEFCPAEDREGLRATLSRLGETEADLPPALEVLHVHGGRGGGAGVAAGARGAAQGAVSEEVARGLRRFALLMQRLEQDPKAAAALKGAPDPRQSNLVAQLLATAALGSRTGEDLEQYVQRLGQLGIATGTDELFRALGQSMPGWALPEGAGGAAARLAASSRPAEAMRRLVSMAGSPQEGIKRFAEMVQAAIEQFNEGNLAQAGAMFEVAGRLVSERKVGSESAAAVRSRAHESLSAERLRRFADRPDKQAHLRKVLDFFPALTVRGLLDELEGEEKRERRKLILALLEAHGPAARAAALERLEARASRGDPDANGFYARNLVFLLRRIPRGSDPIPEKELELLGRLAAWGGPVILIKEAIGALAQAKHRKAEQILVSRLQEFEGLLLRGSFSPADAEELRVLLDRTASALARMGTANAFRTMVNHAFRQEAALGDTLARLGDLGSQDLSGDKELVDHLVAALRAELPKKVLGFFVHKKADRTLHLVQALSGTPVASVRQALQEVAERFPDGELGRAASKALAGSSPAPRPAEAPAMSLSGDLDLFGLPSLLQTVADARMSGSLSLADREGRTIGTLEFEQGKVGACQLGALSGEAAFYQLIERPVPGNFLFKSRREAAGQVKAAGKLMEVLPAMLEAMRRHDELQQARALVPDDASFAPTGVRPTSPSGGEDPPFLRAVWAQASAGATPSECEAAVPADSYRIRRLYAHWLEQGSLKGG